MGISCKMGGCNPTKRTPGTFSGPFQTAPTDSLGNQTTSLPKTPGWFSFGHPNTRDAQFHPKPSLAVNWLIPAGSFTVSSIPTVGIAETPLKTKKKKHSSVPVWRGHVLHPGASLCEEQSPPRPARRWPGPHSRHRTRGAAGLKRCATRLGTPWKLPNSFYRGRYRSFHVSLTECT